MTFDTWLKPTLVVVGGFRSGKKELNTEFCVLTDGEFNCTDQDSKLGDYNGPPILLKIEKDVADDLYKKCSFENWAINQSLLYENFMRNKIMLLFVN